MIRNAFFPVLLLIFCAALSAVIHSELQATPLGPSDTGVAFRLLGSAQEMIGDTLFQKADQYFHRGVGGHRDESDGLHAEEPLDGKAHGAGPENWVRRVNEAVRSTRHAHLGASESKEILPFLALSTRFNPRNVEAVLSAAYWLDTKMDLTDQAIAVLQKGIRDNPRDWHIDLQLGILYLKKKKAYAQCVEVLQQAIPKVNVESLDEFDLSLYYDMHVYLARCYTEMGLGDEALKAEGAAQQIQSRLQAVQKKS